MRKPSASARAGARRPPVADSAARRLKKAPVNGVPKAARRSGGAARQSTATAGAATARAGPARAGTVVAAAGAPAADAPSRRASRGKYVYCIIEATDPLQVRPDRHRRRSVGRLHRPLQEPRRGRLGRAARSPRFDARERARARARQRDGDARAHRHPDVVRHHLQDARGHRRAAAVGRRGVRRRAEQDAEQARVRPEGPLGSRSGDPRGRERKTRTSAG